jgi:hypothetical protein
MPVTLLEEGAPLDWQVSPVKAEASNDWSLLRAGLVDMAIYQRQSFVSGEHSICNCQIYVLRRYVSFWKDTIYQSCLLDVDLAKIWIEKWKLRVGDVVAGHWPSILSIGLSRTELPLSSLTLTVRGREPRQHRELWKRLEIQPPQNWFWGELSDTKDKSVRRGGNSAQADGMT